MILLATRTVAGFMLRHGTRTWAATAKGIEIKARLANVIGSQMENRVTASVAGPHPAAWIDASLAEITINGWMLCQTLDEGLRYRASPPLREELAHSISYRQLREAAATSAPGMQ